jgi:hypothetical protein
MALFPYLPNRSLARGAQFFLFPANAQIWTASNNTNRLEKYRKNISSINVAFCGL